MKKQQIIFISIFLILVLSICAACEQTVTEKEMTLELTLGTRTGTYTGALVDGLPEGAGKFETKNEAGVSWVYDGQWQDGHFNGQGTTTWSDGQKTEGTYVNDLLNGYAKCYIEGGVLYYEGECKDGKFDGLGKLYNNKGKVIYEGKFTGNVPDEETFKDQCQYIAYENLIGSPDDYQGYLIEFSGKIIKITEDIYYNIYQIAMNDDNDTAIYGYASTDDEETPDLLNQEVRIWGIYNGIKTDESAPDSNIKVPTLDMAYMSVE